jgi:hypothetical protein
MNASQQSPVPSKDGVLLRGDSVPPTCSRWTQSCLWIVVAEAGAAIALIEAAVHGDTTLHSNGLHVTKLAYDDIGFTLLAVCILSCISAAVSLARVVKSWNRADAMGLLAAALLGWLGASAFANASGRVTLNGTSTEWVSWPTLLWLLMLMVVFAVRACDVRQGSCSTDLTND